MTRPLWLLSPLLLAFAACPEQVTLAGDAAQPQPDAHSPGGDVAQPADSSLLVRDASAGEPDSATSGPDAAAPGADASADAGESGADASALACGSCLDSLQCGPSSACLQIGGDDRCASLCANGAGCGASEVCATATSVDGTQVQACVPRSGSCTGSGCGACGANETCDWTVGQCVPLAVPPDAGAPTNEHCGTLVGPDVAQTCCTSCTPGSGTCQANGCYGSWWCDTSACRCQRPPTSCASGDAGSTPGVDAGPPGPGPDAGAPITGSVGPNGGSVSRLFFAVTGDTRPGNVDDTSNYPMAIIQKIFDDTQALAPRPQFLVATGDFMFASTTGGAADAQAQLYLSAASHFTNTLFPVMGNHECDGYTSGNCSGRTTANLTAFTDRFLTPMGKTTPYYSVPIQALDGGWKAKLVVVACNVWDTTQSSWLATQLAQSTDYTIVARHEPTTATNAPCVNDVEGLLGQYPYNLLLVGHTHTFSHRNKEVVVGIGGAPLSGSGNYGFATVEQTALGFEVKQYDYASGLAVQSFVVPY